MSYSKSPLGEFMVGPSEFSPSSWMDARRSLNGLGLTTFPLNNKIPVYGQVVADPNAWRAPLKKALTDAANWISQLSSELSSPRRAAWLLLQRNLLIVAGAATNEAKGQLQFRFLGLKIPTGAGTTSGVTRTRTALDAAKEMVFETAANATKAAADLAAADLARRQADYDARQASMAASEAERRRRVAETAAAYQQTQAAAAEAARAKLAADAAAATAADVIRVAHEARVAEENARRVQQTTAQQAEEKDAPPPASESKAEVQCTDGYFRDAAGLCVPNAPLPGPVAQPDAAEVLVLDNSRPTPGAITPEGQQQVWDRTTPATPATPSAGPMGVSMKWWLIGGAGVVVAGLLLSGKKVTPNKRRRRRS